MRPVTHHEGHFSRPALRRPGGVVLGVWTGCAAVLLFGVLVRVCGVHTPDFIFYDEGLYLNTGRPLLEFAFQHPPQSWEEWRMFWVLFFKTCLASGKPLWILLINLRFFFGGLYWWAWPRVLSALFSVMSLFVLWGFARRWRPHNPRIAFWALACLALWPSHIFYARTGLQESLAAFLFLLCVAVYWRQEFRFITVFFSAVLGACVYLSNYRLIILPVFMGLVEFARSRENGGLFEIRRWAWWTVVYTAVIGIIGGLWDGLHLDFVFRWMFFQWNLAESNRQLLDFAAYPFYLWRLDHPLLWTLFMTGTVSAVWCRGREGLPFVLVWAGMMIFCFAKEQAARYTAFLLPFYALGSAVACETAIRLADNRVRHRLVKAGVIIVGILGGLSLISKDVATARIHSGYRKAAAWGLSHPSGRTGWAAASKPIMDLYHDPGKVIEPAPNIVMMAKMVYEGHVRFLFIDPQVYVSYTHSGRSFDTPLIPYLQAVWDQAQPVAQWPHLTPLGLERFVFEHNQDLRISLRFLEESIKRGYDKIYLYDLKALGWDNIWRWVLQRQHRPISSKPNAPAATP